jgi:beta-lactamase regulating signal transducer with metallopeptidase domain
MTASLFATPAGGWMMTLLETAARGLLAAAFVGIGLQVLRAHNVVAQKIAWGLVLAGALLTPFIAPLAAHVPWLVQRATVVLPARSLLSAPPKSQAATTPTPLPFVLDSPAPVTYSRSRAAVERFPAPTVSHSDFAEPAALPAGPLPRSAGLQMPSLGSLIWLLYFAVGAGLLLRLLYGLAAAIVLWRGAEPIEIQTESRLYTDLRVRTSRNLASPVTIGSGIVLPDDYAEWDKEKLRVVLAHERSHVRQGDFYMQLGAGLYAALFWFSPLGWWLKRRLSDLSEAISDRAGLREAASHTSYAQILLEFAARPRPTLMHRMQIGVAMARPGRLAHRIERLLNENSFKQAFAGGRRALVAGVLIPIALFAATSVIRVQAAGRAQQPAPPTAPDTLQATPPTPPVAPPSPDVAPTAPAAPAAAPSAIPAPPEVAPVPPQPPAPPSGNYGEIIDRADIDKARADADEARSEVRNAEGHRYAYSFSFNGDSFAIVSGDGSKHVQFSGDWNDSRKGDFEKARRMTKGDFLWFSHGGKSYIVDDAALVAQIKDMYKPMEDLGLQQKILGKQQEALGREQEKLAMRHQSITVQVPDLSKEMAELNAAMAKLQANLTKVNQEQIAEAEAKMAEVQGKLGALQGKLAMQQGGLGDMQGKLGEEQGKLGEKQGRLGEQQGRIAAEVDRKVKSIIDQSLKNGKAKPIE